MTTPRRLLCLVTTVAAAGLVASAAAVPATARPVDRACLQRGPIPVRALAAAARSGCSLVGRMVTDGRVSVRVPPAGTSVAGEGVGRHGDVRGLTVTNTGATVRAVREAVRCRGGAGAGRRPACKDRTFNLEGHKWAPGCATGSTSRSMPKRLHASTVVHQIKVANANMRKGRNTCHKARLKTPASHYLGRTKAKPNIKPTPAARAAVPRTPPTSSRFGNLPGGLLGWTCYWWGVATGGCSVPTWSSTTVATW